MVINRPFDGRFFYLKLYIAKLTFLHEIQSMPLIAIPL